MIPCAQAVTINCTPSNPPDIPAPPNPNTTCVSAYPATAGFPTGMIKLGSTDTFQAPSSATIDWGDGVTSTALLDCTLNLITTKTSCDYWGHQHIYASPGLYTITVTTNNNHSVTKELPVVPIGNFVIVSIGDSVASGEGNPTVPKTGQHPAIWDYGDKSWNPDNSNGCHGSSTSGPAIAARTIIKDNPSARVTFIHLACSGAKINGGKPWPDNTVGQLSLLIKLLPPGTKIDVLLITVGANNVDNGFGNVVSTCIDTTPTYDCYTGTDTASNNLREALAGIPNLDYSPLADIIHGGTLNVADADVYITNYFDPTHDSAGNFPTLDETKLCSADLMLPNEWMYLYNSMVVPLNTRIGKIAIQYGWHRVGGNDYPIAADFQYHGYCIGLSGASWVVNAPESLITQGDKSGTAHPNTLGHHAYASRIVNAVYDWTLPVTTATATFGGGTYAFDTWTHEDVTVTLSATNKLATAGTHRTKFSVDDPTCTDGDTSTCKDYTDPISITEPGIHTIYFLSDNAYCFNPNDPNSTTLPCHFEKVKMAQVKIDKPVGYDDDISTNIGQSVTGHFQASNPDSSDALTFDIAAKPEHGTATLTDPNKGTFTYTPNPGYIGKDSFTFMLNNGYVNSNIATESVVIATATRSSPTGGGGAFGQWELDALVVWITLSLFSRRLSLDIQQ